MANTPAPAPAAAEATETQASTGYSILDMLDDDAADQRPEASAAAEGDEEPAPEAPTDEPEPEADGSEEDTLEETEQEPSPESDEPKPAEKPKSKVNYEDDEAVTHLRDRTEVTVRDLKAGYERARELETRFLPAIQREYQEFNAQKQQFEAQQQQLQPVLANVAEILQSRIPKAPDPALLDPANAEYDPMEYSRQRDLRALAIEQIQTVEYARREQQAQEERAANARREAYLQQQRQALVTRMPHLREKEKAEAFARDWGEVGRYAGFSPEELGQVLDHRLLVVGELAAEGLRARQAGQRTAAKQQDAQQLAKAKVAAKPPMPKPAVTPPAARTPPAQREQLGARASLERLKKSGSTKDAEDFLGRFA